jgi:DNA-directed RNA polymerase specialized sigma24 family protein
VHTASIPAQVPLGLLRSKRLLALATDGTLVEQIRRGNEAAFSVVFERYAAGLLGFCRHMLGSPEEAEDAVQHTFVAAFRDLARPGEGGVGVRPRPSATPPTPHAACRRCERGANRPHWTSTSRPKA